MRKIILLLTVGAGLVGCASHGEREAMTSGIIGCPTDEVKVSHVDGGWSQVTWTAACRGRVFYCTGTESTTVCSPELK